MITEEKANSPQLDSTGQIFSSLVTTARADSVFGQPVERGDTTVIPCSEIFVGLGMGSGSGPVDENGNATGSGSGGGGGARGRPVAAIVITKDGVRVEPIFDLTRIVLASLTTGAFMLFWIGRLFFVKGSRKGPSFSQLRRAIER
jgi:uncharacterized spore protein YtfJ